MTTYIYKGQEISHTEFITICQMAGVNGGRKKSHYEKLVEMAEQGNEKAQAILIDLEVRHGMKTKRFFAVEVFDSTCNDIEHESGIYGRGDYSWIDGQLNGGYGDYTMTEEEAIKAKEEFEKVIREKNLDWASVELDSVDVPVAETMQDIADYYNDADVLDVAELERIIENAGWRSDCDTDYGVCHNDDEKVVINDEGVAVVIPNMDRVTQRQRIGQRIAQLRKDRGMSQQALADATGIQRCHISRIEMGRYSVGFDTLQNIAEALGGNIDITL